MTKRIDYTAIVGNTYGNYKVISYDGRDFNSKTPKHLYTVEFRCGDTVRHYSNQQYKQVIEGRCKDLEQIKLESKAKRQAKLKKKLACSKKSVEHYERIANLSSKICMSIDGSTSCTGYCISKNNKIIATGQLKPSDGMLTAQRMLYMAFKVRELITKYRVEIIFYEDVIFKNVNVMKVLGRLQGMIEYIALICKCKFISINPSSWKNFHAFTGERKEQKKASIEYASRLMGRIMGEDEADALCLMVYAIKNLGTKEAG